MEISDSNMGNLLSSTNTNNQNVENQQSDDDPSVSTTQTIEPIEESPEDENSRERDNEENSMQLYTEQLSMHDINMIIMGKSNEDETEPEFESEPIPVAGSSNPTPSTSSAGNDLWIRGGDNEGARVENDDDFEVIVKSLETAIVETDRYDIGTVMTSNRETIMSSVVSTSENEAPNPTTYSEMVEQGEQVMLGDLTESDELITRELESISALNARKHSPILQDQCLEVTEPNHEYSTIAETFDEQTSSLFDSEPLEEISNPVVEERSLLELQVATIQGMKPFSDDGMLLNGEEDEESVNREECSETIKESSTIEVPVEEEETLNNSVEENQTESLNQQNEEMNDLECSSLLQDVSNLIEEIEAPKTETIESVDNPQDEEISTTLPSNSDEATNNKKTRNNEAQMLTFIESNTSDQHQNISSSVEEIKMTEEPQNLPSTSRQEIQINKKHSLDLEDKEQIPPKKVKLIRQKEMIKNVQIIKTNVEDVESSSSCSSVVLDEQSGKKSDPIEPVIEAEQSKKSIPEQQNVPVVVKKQKLKLKRNYKPPEPQIQKQGITRIVPELHSDVNVQTTTSVKLERLEAKEVDINVKVKAIEDEKKICEEKEKIEEICVKPKEINEESKATVPEQDKEMCEEKTEMNEESKTPVPVQVEELCDEKNEINEESKTVPLHQNEESKVTVLEQVEELCEENNETNEESQITTLHENEETDTTVFEHIEKEMYEEKSEVEEESKITTLDKMEDRVSEQDGGKVEETLVEKNDINEETNTTVFEQVEKNVEEMCEEKSEVEEESKITTLDQMEDSVSEQDGRKVEEMCLEKSDINEEINATVFEKEEKDVEEMCEENSEIIEESRITPLDKIEDSVSKQDGGKVEEMCLEKNEETEITSLKETEESEITVPEEENEEMLMEINEESEIASLHENEETKAIVFDQEDRKSEEMCVENNEINEERQPTSLHETEEIKSTVFEQKEAKTEDICEATSLQEYQESKTSVSEQYDGEIEEISEKMNEENEANPLLEIEEFQTKKCEEVIEEITTEKEQIETVCEENIVEDVKKLQEEIQTPNEEAKEDEIIESIIEEEVEASNVQNINEEIQEDEMKKNIVEEQLQEEIKTQNVQITNEEVKEEAHLQAEIKTSNEEVEEDEIMIIETNDMIEENKDKNEITTTEAIQVEDIKVTDDVIEILEEEEVEEEDIEEVVSEEEEEERKQITFTEDVSEVDEYVVQKLKTNKGKKVESTKIPEVQNEKSVLASKFNILRKSLERKLRQNAAASTSSSNVQSSNEVTEENITLNMEEINKQADFSNQLLIKSHTKEPSISEKLAMFIEKRISTEQSEILKKEESGLVITSVKSEPTTKLKISKRKQDLEPLRVEVEDLEEVQDEVIPKFVIKSVPKIEERSSPKITIKPIIKPAEETSTPKITIKPVVKVDPLKITITKQKTEASHSILKIYKPEESQMEEQHVPKLTIKPIPKSEEMQHSPRITIKPVKPPSGHSPSTSFSPKGNSNKFLSPNEQIEILHSPKLSSKLEETYPKVTIKPILRPELSPRHFKSKFETSSGVTVEPVIISAQSSGSGRLEPESHLSPLRRVKGDEALSPRLTIKPITKTCEIIQSEDGGSNPLKLTIKPLKIEESYQSPKITIKPVLKPEETELIGDEKQERIILKIQKTNLPSPKERSSIHLKDVKIEPVHMSNLSESDKNNQKLDKIKLKLTKEGSHAQIISTNDPQFSSMKRSLVDLTSEPEMVEKRTRTEFSGTEILHTSDISINLVEANSRPNPRVISEEVTIVQVDKPTEHISQMKFKEMLRKIQQKSGRASRIDHVSDSSSSDDVRIIEVIDCDAPKDSLTDEYESNSRDVMIVNEMVESDSFLALQMVEDDLCQEEEEQEPPPPPQPKKRGRPRKNPLEVKPEIKDEDCVEVVRPKRTCRAPYGSVPFVVKERKPRGGGRGRGRGRGGGRPPKMPKEPKTARGKALKAARELAKAEAERLSQEEVLIEAIVIEDSTTNDTPTAPFLSADEAKLSPVKMCEPQMEATMLKSNSDDNMLRPPPVAVYEEETRMSAENSSRAQTPARQVPVAFDAPEESQSSVQSTATTESNKNKKGRLEIADHDSAITGVDQIVEYSWGTGGPYMLQEQIAQFLGVKSFKRKYPGMTRRPVEMQERDYIREKGLVSESMCDMGLTAVPSSEILDIMYTDFQDKYEEYRKFMRDKQSKEISSKQKAISLATEKNKLDFKERAIQSAASWNSTFNKARKESRRCCMDLQTFTIHYPTGTKQVIKKKPVGSYPIALVPGQFTDYYKTYSSDELRYLPLNTVKYGPVLPNQRCEETEQSDGSQSDSDSSSDSDSDSSDDSMSTIEDVNALPSSTQVLSTTTPAPSVIQTPSSSFVCKSAITLSSLISVPKAKVH